MKTIVRGAILMCLLVTSPSRILAGDYTIMPQADGDLYEVIQSAVGVGPRINLVFIDDGFQNTEQAAFNDSLVIMLDGEPYVDGMWDIHPYDDVKCQFNVFRINVASKDSGVDDPARGIYVNTALDCTFGGASEHVAKITGNESQIWNIIDESGVPGCDYVVVVANAPTHLAAWTPTASRISYLSTANPWGIYLAHELAHAIAKLGDEYPCSRCDTSDLDLGETIPSTAVIDYPNLTNDLTKIPWADQIPDWVSSNPLLFPAQPGLTCDCTVVSAWEGGGYYSYGVYRSQEYCVMDLVMCSSGEVFCTACTRALEDALGRCLILASEGLFVGNLRDRLKLSWLAQMLLSGTIPPPMCWVCEVLRTPPPEVRIVVTGTHGGRLSVYDDRGLQVATSPATGTPRAEVTYVEDPNRRYRLVIETGAPTSDILEVHTELYRDGHRQALP